MSAIFPKLEGLDSLARRDGVDVRPTLVRVLTDLYVQKPVHSSEEERHYTELVLRLIDSVDLSTRAAVAKKIAAYAGAPPAVARRLARDVIEVAEPILRHCRALTWTDLDAISRDFGWAHAAIIATKREAAAARGGVTTSPARPDAAPTTVSKPAAKIPDASAPTADDHGAREGEISLAELFFSADSAARRVLLLSLGGAEPDAPQAVLPLETLRALEAAALARDRAAFARLIEHALSLSAAQAERIVCDESGEPLIVAAKALAMPPVALQRVLMFLDPAIGESVQRFFDLAALYERISADAAHKIIASVRGREPARTRRPAHRPMYYDDEAGRSRRGTGTRRGGATEQAPARPESGRQRTM